MRLLPFFSIYHSYNLPFFSIYLQNHIKPKVLDEALTRSIGPHTCSDESNERLMVKVLHTKGLAKGNNECRCVVAHERS